MEVQERKQSSFEAHQSIKPHKETHYQEITKVMRMLGKGEISRAIAFHCENIDYHEVARRLPEMEKKGLVKVTGRMAHIKHRPLIWELV